MPPDRIEPASLFHQRNYSYSRNEPLLLWLRESILTKTRFNLTIEGKQISLWDFNKYCMDSFLSRPCIGWSLNLGAWILTRPEKIYLVWSQKKYLKKMHEFLPSWKITSVECDATTPFNDGNSNYTRVYTVYISEFHFYTWNVKNMGKVIQVRFLSCVYVSLVGLFVYRGRLLLNSLFNKIKKGQR